LPQGAGFPRPIDGDGASFHEAPMNNPYAPPNAAVADIVAGEAAPALWNPGAASCWSLLLSPVFGSILHMVNWQALGESARAKSSRNWAIGSFAFAASVGLLSAMLPSSGFADALGTVGNLGLLVVWYYASGKVQGTYIAEKFGREYPRRGWLKPIMLAFLALFFFVAGLIIVGFGLGLFSPGA
jgi:hypothetical protein